MVLTINYADLQNIKEQVINDKITYNEKIYTFIQDYKDTLDNMYKKNLVPNMSKTDYEFELMKFANEMLKNTNKSYKTLEKEYGDISSSRIVVGLKDIRLIL